MYIAVVDDETVICEQIKNLIQKARPDSRITVYTSGQSFLAAGKPFDLVYLDIQMEGMTGMEAAREFRKVQPDAVLIFVTGAKE